MGRISGETPTVFEQSFTVTCGATDQDNLLTIVAPCAGASVRQIVFVTTTAGTGTGTFTVELQSADVAIAGKVTIDADAAANTIHGTSTGNGVTTAADGDILEIATVKTGTVSGDAVLKGSIIWQV